jgi:hypothetical protein
MISLTKVVIGVAIGIIVIGGVVFVGVAVIGSSSTATAVDVATSATCTAANNDAVGAVVPLSLTEDKDVYVGAIGAFADGGRPLGNDNHVRSTVGEGDSGGGAQ